MKENYINYSEFIERYLDGEMTDDELKWFEKEINGNLSLQQEITLRKKVNEALSENKIIEYRKLLNEAHFEYQTAKNIHPIKKSILKYSLAFISAVAILFICFNSFILKNTPEKIFQKYYQTFPATFTLRSINTGEINTIKDAINEYNKRNFEKSALLFEQLILSNNYESQALKFYAAISYMEIKNYQKAEKFFTEILENNNNIFKEESMWYLALCYIAQNKSEESKNILKKIVEYNGYYSKYAKKILHKIR